MAISYVTAAQAYTNNTGTATGGTTTSAGDLVVVFRDMFYGGGAYSIACNDTVNGGAAYTQSTVPIANGTTTTFVSIFWKVYAAGLTPNATFTGTGALATQTSGGVSLTQWTGFLGTATAITADAASSSGTSTAVNSGSLNTSNSNELLVGYTDAGSSNYATAPTTFGWTQNWNPVGKAYVFSQIGVAQTTNISLQGTLSASANWTSIFQGFYDNQISTGPGPFYYRRNVLYSI